MTNYELIRDHSFSTAMCSVNHHMRLVSTTYNDIMLLGWSIVPDILKYLQDNESGMSVMLLLWDITHHSPYQPIRIGSTSFSSYNVREAREAWIAWGVEQQLL